MARHCNVDLKDRREAVLSLLRREEPAALIARRIGVSEPTLYRWRDEFLAAGEAALASGRAPFITIYWIEKVSAITRYSRSPVCCR